MYFGRGLISAIFGLTLAPFAFANVHIETRPPTASEQCGILLIQRLDVDIPQEFSARLQDLTARVDALIKPVFKKPLDLHVTIDVDEIAPGFHAGLRQFIRLSYMNGQRVAPNGPTLAEVAYVHEYGHAVFEANIARFAGEWGKRFKDLNEAMRELQAEIQEVDARRQGHLDKKAQLKQLGRDTEARVEKGLAREAKAQEVYLETRLKHLISLKEEMESQAEPYNELFADLITTVTFGDGAIIAKVLKAAGAPKPELRDFTVKHQVRGWNAKVADYVSTGEERNPFHVFYSPVRSFVWDEYFSNTEALNAPAPVFELLLHAAGAELAPQTLARLDVEERNDALIGKLRPF